MSSTPTRAKRNGTARELAERFGVSPRTIQRTVAQSREDYLNEAAQRRARIRALRAEGLSMRTIAEREGVTVGAVHYALNHKQNAASSPSGEAAAGEQTATPERG